MYLLKLLAVENQRFQWLVVALQKMHNDMEGQLVRAHKIQMLQLVDLHVKEAVALNELTIF